MASRFFTAGVLATLTTLAAVATVSAWRHPHLRPSVAAGTAHLRAFGSRSREQQRSTAGAKFDGTLAELSRHAALARPDHALEDLRAMAPAGRFKQNAADAPPLVLIDAVTRGDPKRLKAALVSLGLQHPSVYSNDVGGWLPVSELDAATARAEVHSIRAAMPRTRTGAVASQGDFAQHSDLVRSANSLTGAGVTVGVLSDSYDRYAVYAANNVPAGGAAGYANNGFTATAATDASTGDVPSNVNVLQEADPSGKGCMNYGASHPKAEHRYYSMPTVLDWLRRSCVRNPISWVPMAATTPFWASLSRVLERRRCIPTKFGHLDSHRPHSAFDWARRGRRTRRNGTPRAGGGGDCPDSSPSGPRATLGTGFIGIREWNAA